MCVFIIKGGTNGQDVPEPLDTYVLSKFSPPKNIIIEHLAISFKPYELYLQYHLSSMVLIQEVGVFTSWNTSVGSGGLFMHTSLKLLVIVVIFIEHGLTI